MASSQSDIFLTMKWPAMYVLLTPTHLTIIIIVFNIALLTEINLKQQLVDQLEKAQNNFYSMKSQYEDKMQLLQHQIKSIESERDRVLKDIGKFVHYFVLQY